MVSFRGLIQNFRRASPPLSYAESSPPPGLTVTDVQNCEEDNDASGAQKAGRCHINEVVGVGEDFCPEKHMVALNIFQRVLLWQSSAFEVEVQTANHIQVI